MRQESHPSGAPRPCPRRGPECGNPSGQTRGVSGTRIPHRDSSRSRRPQSRAAGNRSPGAPGTRTSRSNRSSRARRYRARRPRHWNCPRARRRHPPSGRSQGASPYREKTCRSIHRSRHAKRPWRTRLRPGGPRSGGTCPRQESSPRRRPSRRRSHRPRPGRSPRQPPKRGSRPCGARRTHRMRACHQ